MVTGNTTFFFGLSIIAYLTRSLVNTGNLLFIIKILCCLDQLQTNDSRASAVATKTPELTAGNSVSTTTYHLKKFFSKSWAVISKILGLFALVTDYIQESRLSRLIDGHLNRQSYAKLLLIKLSLWLAVWSVFIWLEFGAIFFIITLIGFIYFNTRTGPRTNKLSAYSVFNPGCERIDGTLTAEQFEKELRYGPNSVQ